MKVICKGCGQRYVHSFPTTITCPVCKGADYKLDPAQGAQEEKSPLEESQSPPRLLTEDL